MSEYTVEKYEFAPGIVVRIEQDMDGSMADPRQNDNVSVMVMSHRSYDIGDRKLEWDEEEALKRGGWKLLRRYLRMAKGVIAMTKVGMYDHSGITIYPVGTDDNGHYVFDEAGWDSGIIGFAYITKDRWVEMMGDSDPNKDVEDEVTVGFGRLPVMRSWTSKVLASEIEEYDSWLRGEVYGYIVESHSDPECHDDRCTHHVKTLDSCWGYVGDMKYVKEEAESAAKYWVEHPDQVAEA